MRTQFKWQSSLVAVPDIEMLYDISLGFKAFGSRESFEGSASSLRLRELPCFTSRLVDLGFSRFDDDSSGREGNAGSAGKLGSNGIVVGVDADADATGVLQPTSAADKWLRMASSAIPRVIIARTQPGLKLLI